MAALQRLCSPIRRAGALATLVVAASACGARAASPAALTPPGAPPGARRLDSALAVATFDSAWRTVDHSLAARGARRPDWDAVRAELQPAAGRARTGAELRAVIGRMLARLGESHFAIAPGGPPAALGSATDGAAGAPDPAAALGTVGIEPRLVGDRLVVWRVEPDGPAGRAGVRPGWSVERVDAFVADAAIAVADSTPGEMGRRRGRLRVVVAALGALRGAPESAVAVTVRDLEGASRTLLLVRAPSAAPVVRFGNLPPLPVPFESVVRRGPAGGCVAVVRFEYWMPPVAAPFEAAMDSARACDGLVIDLRGNLGGVAGMVMGVAGYFVDTVRTLGIMRAAGQEMRFVANPRRATAAGIPAAPYARPLAIVVDELSASTSEIFAAAMQTLGRARVFGVRTAGQALPAMATRLPSGDVLMHVVADFVAPDGRRIEGEGVVPDEVVPLSVMDLEAGRDGPLEAALRWVERQAAARIVK